jgi:hypothetical protein
MCTIIPRISKDVKIWRGQKMETDAYDQLTYLKILFAVLLAFVFTHS